MINLNGTLQEDKDACLSIFNRGFAYGDAVFETIRVINSKIIFWEDHYFRFMASMRIMRMEIPANFSPEFLEEEIKTLVKANNLENSAARVKFISFRKEGGYYSPKTHNIGYTITVEPLENSFYILNEEDYEIELFKDHYLNSGLLSTLKSNNRSINVLGSIFAKENSYSNCLLINEKKNVVEALQGNIFLVQNRIVKTPPLTDGALNGIVRKNILKILAKVPDYKVEETSISPFELQRAEELFISNTIVGIQPVTKYRKKEYSNKLSKELVGKLNAQARLA